jgi:nucleoside-diphosphate-sugar epimerase
MSEVDRFSPSATAAIIGASGDIGSNLANYLVRNGVKVICSVRPASLHRFKARVNYVGSLMRVFVGDMLDSDNLRKTIWDADIIYNMAGVVTLGARPEEFARVIAVNGFAQGVITHWIQQAGKGEEVKVVYPSSQRVHLALAHASVDTWVQEAVEAFSTHRDALVDKQDISTALGTFAAQFLVVHPLPTQCNVYEISKRLGEHLVSWLPQHCLMRISGVYGPGFTRGFIARAVHPQPEGNFEAAEKRDFVYIDDLNDLL